ncbi:MAG: hypothetical protein O3A63_17665, partial [Proteobacteria bacterium]|nr:hypothetical protein [Pseudomonadota bacterium]
MQVLEPHYLHVSDEIVATRFNPEMVLCRDVGRLKRLISRRDKTAETLLQASSEALAARRAHDFKIEFPADLPITQAVDEIQRQLNSNQVLVVAGETGSGKTTQLPKLCLAAGYGR